MEKVSKRAETALDLIDNYDEVPLGIKIQRNLSRGDFALKPQYVTNEEAEEIVVNETVQDIDHPYIGRQVGDLFWELSEDLTQLKINCRKRNVQLVEKNF